MYKEFEKDIDLFIKERNWDRYHTVKNLIGAHVCETAELLELFISGDYKKELDEVKKELGDCFVTLFCLYRKINFSIGDHLEEKLYHDGSIECLIKVLTVKACFLQEAFLWVAEDECLEYVKEIPVSLLTEPFKICLTLCHLLKEQPLEIMNRKLSLIRKKYCLSSSNHEHLKKLNKKKSERRGSKC
jgi:NTP pyrophosphatase (non-canonical NTP hydrolase)